MVSCSNRGAGDPLSIPYVKEILSDTTSVPFQTVKHSGDSGSDGPITLVGPAEDVIFLADEFLGCDHFDNVDGRQVPDGLPDFAGETISLICDEANGPYYGYMEKGNETYLKELTVKNFISAVDTSCAFSQYDRDTKVHKSSSKVVVLTSSYTSAYGYDDIEALVKGTGSEIDVISPVHAMFRYAMKRHGGDKAELAVWTTSEILGSGVYATVLEGMQKEYPSLKYKSVCPDEAGTMKKRMLSFLEMCKESGQKTKIDAVLVDAMPLRADSLNALFCRLKDNADDSIASYSSILSDDFEFIDSRIATAAECIIYLRRTNGFTHRVAYPAMEMYAVMPMPDMPADKYLSPDCYTDEYKYNRASGSDKESFLTVELNDRDITESQYGFMKQYAHKTYEKYVSK